jgi:D-sedoheptulose 7-phosphate isomerase
MPVRVFTNGCFDILHPGHIDLLVRAKALGDHLTVGLNSDASVKRIKGSGRPIMAEDERRAMLLALNSVDEVVIFEQLTPEQLIIDLSPDVLVKGGDWKESEIIGSDHVIANGGRVVTLPLLDGFSSSAIIDRLRSGEVTKARTESSTVSFGSLNEHLSVIKELRESSSEVIRECSAKLIETFRSGGKVLVCGNGGSAADSQHIAAEFVGRYETERTALPAVALSTDTSALTAIGNDYGFERIFARQVEALANPGDCLIAISTSGNSPNVIAAVMAARKIGASVIGMTGASGKKLASLSDSCLMVPSTRTARIQEAHITVAHIWCEMIDAEYAAQ